MDESFRVGLRFKPTVQELIYLLELQIRDQQLPIPRNTLVEKKLYGQDATPWNVFTENDHWDIFDPNGKKNTKRMVYVFSRLKRMSPKKVTRTAGLGTWEGETKPKDITNNQGEKIGSMKMFSFVLNYGSPVKGHWIMHEYSLAGVSLNGIDINKAQDYVICRIVKDDSRFTKVKSLAIKKMVAAEPSEDHVQGPTSGSCAENSSCPQAMSNDLGSLQITGQIYTDSMMDSTALCQDGYVFRQESVVENQYSFAPNIENIVDQCVGNTLNIDHEAAILKQVDNIEQVQCGDCDPAEVMMTCQGNEQDALIDGKHNFQLMGNLDTTVTSFNQATEAENLKIQQQSLEEQADNDFALWLESYVEEDIEEIEQIYGLKDFSEEGIQDDLQYIGETQKLSTTLPCVEEHMY